MHRDFAFLQTAPNRIFVGWGPFEQLSMRKPDRPAFYIADFFLEDPHPWRHPAAWEELSLEEISERFSGATAPRIEWQPLEIAEFRPLFDSARAAIARGEFQKIVPVQFESGRVLDRVSLWPSIFRHLRNLPHGLWAYGYSYQNRGLAGATPEMLFESNGAGYRTMALAGTRPAERAAELLHDPKELREHRFVVEDIVRRLAPFGNVAVEDIGILTLPALAHLATPIRFEEVGPERMSFVEMVRRLHPTAALGVSPRSEAGERWLRDADRGVRRRTFGAPFGLEIEDRRALAVVAIRNVEWRGESIRVGSGAGLLAESRIEREFEELREKREQIKALLGLAAPIAIGA